MRHPEQQALASYPPLSAVPPSPATQETARLIAETIPFNLERGGRTIEATYSTRNGIVTVKYRARHCPRIRRRVTTPTTRRWLANCSASC